MGVNVGKSPYWVLWEGTDKAGCAGLGLGRWNSFSRLRGRGAAPSWLVPGRGDQGREMGARVGQPCVKGEGWALAFWSVYERCTGR